MQSKLVEESNLNALKNKPSDYLAQCVSQKDIEIQMLKSKLDECCNVQEKLEIDRNKLANERNTLIEDLERLLNRRQVNKY